MPKTAAARNGRAELRKTRPKDKILTQGSAWKCNPRALTLKPTQESSRHFDENSGAESAKADLWNGRERGRNTESKGKGQLKSTWIQNLEEPNEHDSAA